MSKEVIENCLKELIANGDKKTIDNVIGLLLAVKDFNRSPSKTPVQTPTQNPKPKMFEKKSEPQVKQVNENVSHGTIPDANYASLLLEGIDEERARKRVPRVAVGGFGGTISVVGPDLKETMSEETMSYLDQLL